MIAFDTVNGLIESYHIDQVSKKNSPMDDGRSPGEYSSRDEALAARRSRNA